MVKKIYIGILLVIFGGIVLHAPISMGLGALWPNYSLLIKSWKEILMLVAGLITLFLLYKNKKISLLRDPIMIAIGVYALLHLALLFYANQGLKASLTGLVIDLRYVLFFGLVYIALHLYPNYKKLFINVGIIGAFIVVIFAVLQVFVLPYDVLKYIGYNHNTIMPYLTIDQNYDFIRINSTLRGPNPLGAYAVIVLSLIVSFISKHKFNKKKLSVIFFVILSVGCLVALWSSYSRSALIAALAVLLITALVVSFKKISIKFWVAISATLIVLIGGFFMVRNTDFVSNVLLHNNPESSSVSSSNEGHINSLKDGFNQLIDQPLGAGIGSTGSASMFTDHPEIIENQYLFIAHEVGWIGTALFISIVALIMFRLWKLRSDWLALSVFTSGIGLLIIGLLLPVWVDDTVSIVWWGLAAIAISINYRKIYSNGRSKGQI